MTDHCGLKSFDILKKCQNVTTISYYNAIEFLLSM